jgi:hypothetical protein
MHQPNTGEPKDRVISIILSKIILSYEIFADYFMSLRHDFFDNAKQQNMPPLWGFGIVVDVSV